MDHEPSAADTDPPAHTAPMRLPAHRRPELAAAVVGALVLLALGYGIGYSRGSADLDHGASPTTSTVKAGRAAASTSSTTGTTIDIAAVVPLPLPAVATSTETFDQTVPTAIDGHPVSTPDGPWIVQGGTAAPAQPDPLPASATDARLVGEGPDLLVDLGRPASLATTRLATPTPFSGLVFRGVDPGNYWALVADKRLGNLTVYEVKGGRQTAKGFVEGKVEPGASVGLLAVAGQIGVVVDGRSVPLRTFYGPRTGVADDGIAGGLVGLLTGRDEPSFDDLTFG